MIPTTGRFLGPALLRFQAASPWGCPIISIMTSRISCNSRYLADPRDYETPRTLDVVVGRPLALAYDAPATFGCMCV